MFYLSLFYLQDFFMEYTKTKETDSKFTEHYLGKIGELTLKGSNLKTFEKQLVANLRNVLETVDAHVALKAGRLYVHATKESCPGVEYALDHLLGITGWAKVIEVEKSVEAITDKVTELCKEARDNGAKTFKIDARREDKEFPLDSYGIARQCSAPAYDSGILSVDVHNPDLTINVEVRNEVFVYTDHKKTHRGLPVGVSGKGLLLLSGGLDSPVAGYKMLGRGMKIECAYFHSYPYTSEEAQKKVEDLAKVLSDYGLDTHLNIIPFTQVQMEIKKKSPEAFTTLMLRVCMMKACNLLAERINADCLITGESLGQVASQTIQNMTVTEHFADKPLLRPLIGTDKEDIVRCAEKIGSYGISILPYEDCCVLFSPRHPVLKAQIDEAVQIYENLGVDDLIKKAFEERKIIRFTARDNLAEKFATKAYTKESGLCLEDRNSSQQ